MEAVENSIYLSVFDSWMSETKKLLQNMHRYFLTCVKSFECLQDGSKVTLTWTHRNV